LEPEDNVSPSLWVALAIAAAALSGFFSLAGYSLRSFRRAGIEGAFNGSSQARRLAVLEEHLAALMLTTSFVRTVSNLVLVMSMFYLFALPQAQTRSQAVLRAGGALGCAAAIIAVFGVAIPHAWASCAGEKVVAATLPVLMVFRRALHPVVAVMRSLDLPVRRLAGADDDEADGDAAKQEILQAASEGRAEGAVDADEVDMIESVMEFGDTQAGQIMTPRTDIVALPAQTPFDEAARRIVEAGHTRVPVYQGDLDHIIGILYAKDLLGQTGRGDPPAIRSILRKPFFVPETKPLDDLLRELKARKVHIAVVLDEYGGTAGLITIEDLLEEIVGEISDEYDRATPALMQRIDERTAEVDGRMYIDDLNDAMGLEIPEDADYDTVAGLVFSELGYIPTVGETLTACGASFTVLAADERKITRLRVQLAEKATDEQT